MADISSNTQQLPQWVIILQALNIPTLAATIFGGLIGYGASFITNQINSKNEDKKWRQGVAEQIHKQVFSYNGVAINALQQMLQNPQIFIDAVGKLNEAEALADLYMSEEVLKNIEVLKSLVFEIKKEIEQNMKDGKPSGSRHELKSGEKYDVELKKLRDNLKVWIEKG
jgi:hypothetical protein